MYDSDQSTVTDALKNANPVIFSDDTINKILNLTTKAGDAKISFDTKQPDAQGNVTVAAGTEVVFVQSADDTFSFIKPPANAPVVIFQGKGGVTATFNDGVTVPSGNQSTVDRVVVGSAGGDTIVIADAKNTNIVLGTGNSSVTTGGGVDTVEAGLGNSTIVGGSGDYAVVKLAGNASNYQVTAQNGHAVVTNQTTLKTTDISKIQYVQLDNGNALIFAKNSVEGQISLLYSTTFGRTADAGGLDYWFDLGRGGATLKQIATAFANSSEFSSYNAGKTNEAFIQTLYQNTFNRAGEDAGVAYWVGQMANGQSQGDILASFATIAVQNIMYTAPNQEAQIVGSVSIITGII